MVEAETELGVFGLRQSCQAVGAGHLVIRILLTSNLQTSSYIYIYIYRGRQRERERESEGERETDINHI